MRTKPFVVGLTGSIGCGKSTAVQTLVSLGAEGIDADKVAHAVMSPGGRAYRAVLEAFGAELLAADGQIDRQRLGQQVFTSPEALARLESIVHPAVGEAIRARFEATTAPLVAIEAIKLLEAGLSSALCDEVWVVACPAEQQLARLKTTRGMAADEVERRRSAQMPESEMLSRADRVIDTSGTVSGARLQVLAAWLDLGLPLPGLELRPAVLDDAEGIAEVLNSVVRAGGLSVLDGSYTAETERGFLSGLPKRSRFTVALLGRVLVGFLIAEPYAAYTHALDHVATMGTYVWEGVRGRGIGRALAGATVGPLASQGYEKIVVNIRADNPAAQRYYEALGFRPAGCLARQAFVDGHYVDELLFERFLDRGEG